MDDQINQKGKVSANKNSNNKTVESAQEITTPTVTDKAQQISSKIIYPIGCSGYSGPSGPSSPNRDFILSASTGTFGITAFPIISGFDTFSTGERVVIKQEDVEYLKSLTPGSKELERLYNHVSKEAKDKINTSNEFKECFRNGSKYQSVVVSIDIRRSTELMLKALTPDHFASFIIELRQKLIAVILNNFGIYDKFTGDGILAFFPDFYSGDHALYHALKAATECHHVFNKHYLENEDSFAIFIKGIGLGIGIDYGSITLLNEGGELTVVGTPVVYACRLSGISAGNTVLNVQAKKQLEKLFPNKIVANEAEIEIKNEGTAKCYTVKILNEDIQVDTPKWLI